MKLVLVEMAYLRVPVVLVVLMVVKVVGRGLEVEVEIAVHHPGAIAERQ